MRNNIILLILLVGFSTMNAKYKKHVTKQLVGQEHYLKRCSQCHGEGNRGGNLYSIREWKKMFAASGAILIELHDGEKGTQEVIQYLKSKDFKNENPKMLKFIQEFAYDSNTIPTCN